MCRILDCEYVVSDRHVLLIFKDIAFPVIRIFFFSWSMEWLSFYRLIFVLTFTVNGRTML